MNFENYFWVSFLGKIKIKIFSNERIFQESAREIK
jgi:hypothetical protein